VERISVRVLPLAAADGAHNMAADEVLLQSAAAGQATLRFYTWSEATLSLGYFQPAAARLSDPRLAALPYVRRPTGGGALVHHHELTYALALPERAYRLAREPWLSRMHDIILRALRTQGVRNGLSLEAERRKGWEQALCFQQLTPGDLIYRGSKVAGSAQRRQRQALLQHGGILLSASPFTPELLGITELAAVRLEAAQVARTIRDEFAADTGWDTEEGTMTTEERAAAEELAARKYCQSAWNDKR
jgi:lipoate-protein ligase A